MGLLTFYTKLYSVQNFRKNLHPNTRFSNNFMGATPRPPPIVLKYTPRRGAASAFQFKKFHTYPKLFNNARLSPALTISIGAKIPFVILGQPCRRELDLGSGFDFYSSDVFCSDIIFFIVECVESRYS